MVLMDILGIFLTFWKLLSLSSQIFKIFYQKPDCFLGRCMIKVDPFPTALITEIFPP